MTNNEVLDLMSKEIDMWYEWQQLTPMCVNEALIEYNDILTIYQRNYLNEFLRRWEAFEE